MRWYTLLFSIIFRSVLPNSSNHCNRQFIIIMYSYICIMFCFCVRQNFVCHTKRVASVPSHHRPAKWSSVMSLPSILPRKSIVLPPSISPPMHADSLSQFLMKQLKLSLRTNYSKMELFYFKQQTKTPSPTKLATVTPLAKKTYDESFTKVNCQIHPSVIPFLSPMNVKKPTMNNWTMQKYSSLMLHPWTTTPSLLQRLYKLCTP